MSERTQNSGTCKIQDCDRASRSLGMCNRHYENHRRYGNPVPQRDRPLAERIETIGWTVTERGCWEWNGKRNEHGYGVFSAGRLGITDARAHRVVYEQRVGSLPDGLVLRHSCDNPPCVNPDHLEPGTQADNIRDMVERGRHWAHGRTECGKGHDLAKPGATRVVKRKRGSETICVLCARERGRRYARSKRTV